MVDERAAIEGGKNPIPEGLRWADLAAPQMEGVKLEAHYRYTLETLGKQGGMLGLIFRKAQNKIQNPTKLRAALEQIEDILEDLQARAARVKSTGPLA
jgi:type I restriction enzyme M protein